MAEAIYAYEILPYVSLYKQSLWSKYVNNTKGIIYVENNAGKVVEIFIRMDRSIIF